MVSCWWSMLSGVIIFTGIVVPQVSAEVSRRSMLVSVDGSKPESVTMKGNQLDVDNKLYLGGLPHSFTTRRLNVWLLIHHTPKYHSQNFHHHHQLTSVIQKQWIPVYPKTHHRPENCLNEGHTLIPISWIWPIPPVCLSGEQQPSRMCSVHHAEWSRDGSV